MKHIAIVVMLIAAHARADDRCARLVVEHDRAVRWNVAWGIGLGAAAIVQAGAAPLISNREQRDTLIVGAAESAIGGAASLVTPLRLPDNCDLDEAAHRERVAFWLNHVGSIVVDVGGALVLAHYTTTANAALSFAISYAVSLARTYTMPRWAMHPIIAIDPKSMMGIGVSTQF